MDGKVTIQDESVLCGTCTHCENGCASSPDSPVRDCQDYNRKLSSIDIPEKKVRNYVNRDDADIHVRNQLRYLCYSCIHQNEGCIPNDGYDCSNWEAKHQPPKSQAEESDQVNHPSHYTQGGIECIKCIEASMKPEGFQDYCKGNVIKYIHRWREKGGVQDLRKASVYLNWLIESAENGRIS